MTTGARPRPRADWVGVKNREVKLASRARKHQSAGHWDLIELNLGCLQKVHAGCMRPTRGGNRSRLLAVVVNSKTDTDLGSSAVVALTHRIAGPLQMGALW